jgi:nucleotide-binding universal stress UspA family protein
MYSRIFVPVDGRPASARALTEAIRLAVAGAARLVVVAVSPGAVDAMEAASTPGWQDSSNPALSACTELVESAAARARRAGVACEKVIVDSLGRSNTRALLDEAGERGCDLMVLGVAGRPPLTRLALGHEAEAVLRDAKIPVMLVNVPTMERARLRRLGAGPGQPLRWGDAEALLGRAPAWMDPRALS